MGTKFVLGSHGMKALEILVPGTSALHPHSQNYSFRSSTGKSMNTIRENIYILKEREVSQNIYELHEHPMDAGTPMKSPSQSILDLA